MRNRVWRSCTNGWQWFWSRVSINFALGLLAMGVVASLLWSFDFIPGDLRRVVLTVACGALPVILLVGPERPLSERLKVDWGLLGTILLLLTALLMAISHRQGWSSLGLNAGILLFSSPILLVIGRLVFRKPLLGVGLGLPMVMAMAALIVLVVPREYIWNFLLLPLPAILLPAAVWALFLYGVHHVAKQTRARRIWGPLLESVLMVVMFAPVVALAILVHVELELDDRWLTVVVAVVGLLFSSVVSVPLRQFLLDLGDLPPNPRWEGKDDGF